MNGRGGPAESGRKRSELLRLLMLAAAAAWLLHPFATGRKIGAGDALWYANMLADFVLQWRAGIFPVFVGQTIHAFNGAVYPLRVCPLYQHLAGALDLLTLHRLGFFALQHGVVIFCGVAGIFGCYFALTALAPARRWSAALLSVLYLGCPGVLALVYTQDLYMSWMTVPFLPLAVYGIVRTFRRDDLVSQFWLAAPLAALWWGHSPIAMWTTFAAAFSQIVRLAVAWRNGERLRSLVLRAAAGAVIFAALAQYPFVSVASLRAPGAASPVDAPLADPGSIAGNIRVVFPAVFLPLSEGAENLSDLQLGYGLWAVLIFATLAALRRGPDRLALRLLLLSSAGFLLLLMPIPGLNPWLWAHMPGVIKRITLYWPMQRFYPILAVLIPFAGQLALSGSPPAGSVPPAARRWSLVGLMALGCAWCLWESRQFIRAGRERTASEQDSQVALRPENLLLMNHSYGLFPALPPYFSNGTMDPEAETRLLSAQTLQPQSVPLRGPAMASRWQSRIDANPGILDLAPVLHLQPGRRYELELHFTDRAYHGVLELIGHTFFRQYVLPHSGEREAFGSGPGNSHALPLWTTEASGDDIALRFIPTKPGESPGDYRDFGAFTLREIDPVNRLIHVTGLIPFQATIASPIAGWVETPRMFTPGYAATVDGKPVGVHDSPQGLAMFPIRPGVQKVALRFSGSILLRSSYLVGLFGWLALLIVCCVRVINGFFNLRTFRI